MFKYLLLKCYYKSKNNDTSHDINNFYIDSEWTCPICYNEISNNLILYSPFECKHIYCSDCLNMLLQWNKFSKCSLCESKLKKSMYYKNMTKKYYNYQNLRFIFFS